MVPITFKLDQKIVIGLKYPPPKKPPDIIIKHKEQEYYSYFTRRSSKYLENIGLVSLFNGISTFVGYLMPKLLF